MYPLGYVLRVIKAGEHLVDSQRVINLLYHIPTRPNPACIDAAASLTNFVGNEAEVDVEDIRHQLTISIDPSGCRDVDDALTLSQLPTGGFLVGVHIADVGRFVEEGGVIDSNARRRMMSFYAATDVVYHMLPDRLSADVCSLLQGQDRSALSVYLETDEKFNITETNIRSAVCRSLIRNNRQMTYEEAQQVIDEAVYQRFPWKEDSVKTMVVYLHQIAQHLRIDRLNQARFCVSEPDDPFCHAGCHEAHQLIEEFMIQTNFTVAQFLVERFPESVPVRRQKSPDEDDVRKWFSRHEVVAQVSMYFKQFDMFNSFFNRQMQDDESDNPRMLSFLQSTIDGLKAAVESRDLRKAVSLIARETQHPLHLLAMNGWFQIQVCAHLYFVTRSSISYTCWFFLCLHWDTDY